MSAYETQEKIILNLLRQHANAWVPLPTILALGISQYGSRILTLRRRGWTIENRVERVGKSRHSAFRLVTRGQQDLFA